MFEPDPDGATPIDEDEAEGLIPTHIETRAELNVWEQENILEAVQWARGVREAALQESFVRKLHGRMFDQTWEWAGSYRRSDKNIGVAWPSIPEQVVNLVDDGRYWLDHGTFDTDEAALRLHHRLAKIHPFPNGNGRHARLWCDIILGEFGREPFKWKNTDLEQAGGARAAYISALRGADGEDYDPLFTLFLRDR